MSANIAISVKGVTKEFVLRSAVGTRTLKSAVLGIVKSRRGKRFKALDDISFDVNTGETLGIIGANGAGKSTLLSIVAGTMAATSGQVNTHGTISSLLELGAGFHPDLTGSENIYLYGAIMGLSRAQMRDRFDAIVRFAGIEHYIDQPVKHYSSGMYVRLGFAVAVEVNPDILLIDEVLAVGDSEFQRKCIEKMQDFRDHGKTMLIISHDLRTIQSISDRIVVLQEGKIVGIGLPDNMVRAYQSIARRGETSGIAREWGTGDARITGVRFMDDSGKETAEFEWGATLCAEIAYETSKRIDNPVFGFSMGDMRGRTVFGNNTQIEGIVIPMIEGTGKISLRLKKLNMAAGTYLFSFSLHSSDHRINYHRLDNQFPVAVSCNKSFEGCCYMDTTWTVK